MKTSRFLLACAAAALCLRAASAAPQYVVTDLGPLPTPEYGNVERGALALNDAGQVVGGSGHAFLWDGEKTSDLGYLPPEGSLDDTESVAYGINSRGQIVGSSGSFRPIFMSGLVVARGFLYQNNRLSQLTGNGSFEPYAINDRGQIVGLDDYRGFLYENGRLTQLGTLSHVPVGNRSTARAVSNAGQVVGWSTVNKGTFGAPYAEGGRTVRRRGQWITEKVRLPTRTFFTHACLWRVSGKAVRQRDLGTLPGWVNSYAYGINDRGEVTGSVSDTSGGTYGVSPNAHAQAFLWRGGKMTALGTLPGCRSSEAFGINNAGAFVGQSDGRAFLWQGGRMLDLNALLPAGSDWVLAEARAINNKGQIAGNGTLHGVAHAFLLRPR